MRISMRRSLLPWALLWVAYAGGIHAFQTEDRFDAGTLHAILPDLGETILPLKNTEIELEVTANLVHARVRQVFYNDSNHNLEAVYTFPLPTNATVTDMALVFEGRRIRSVVKEREAAVQTYTAARARGNKAALLEQERPNLFTTSVANFQPGEEVEISFSYLEQLPFNGHVYEINVPMTFGPRYVPREEPVAELELATLGFPPDQARISPPVSDTFTDHLVSLKATVRGLPVREIYSNTHSITVDETEPEIYEVAFFESGVLPDRDFTLNLALWEEEIPQISFLQSEGINGVHGLLTVFPPLKESPSMRVVPKEVLFLIDTSGSMNGEPMRQAKEGLRSCLAMLQPGDRFNIVRFSHDYASFRTGFRVFDEQGEREAGRYIDSLRANGGTEMQKALNYVLDLPREPGYLSMVVFLTDGDVGNEASLMRLVRTKLDRSRIFSFGVSSAPNEYLLRKLSEAGHGVANFIKNEEDIGEVMSRFFETINAPVMTDVNVAWKPSHGDALQTVAAYPEVVPDVYLNRPVQLCYRYPDAFEGEIEVRGLVNGVEVAYDYPVNRVAASAHPGVEQVFGRAMVNDCMVDWINAATPEERDRFRREVIDIALAYQLISKFTARVAVEERITASPSGDLVSVSVPVLAKHGAEEGYAFAATATNDPLRLALGLIVLAGGLLCYRWRATLSQSFG